jgi:hypothetical protein
MNEHLPLLIRLAGAVHFGILIASAWVPFRLNWQKELASLPKLHLQTYLVYGGYILLCILAFGVISLANAEELSSGFPLAAGSTDSWWCSGNPSLLPTGVGFETGPDDLVAEGRVSHPTGLFLTMATVYGYAALRKL